MATEKEEADLAVGRRVRALRERLGLTQQEMGERAGFSKIDATQLENGRGVSDAKLGMYAGVLGCSVPYLRFGAMESIDLDAHTRVAFDTGFRTALNSMRAALDAMQASTEAPAVPSGVPDVPAPRPEKKSRRKAG